MITLKLRGRHCPTHHIARVGQSTGRGRDGLIGYEINPDVLSDIIDELCDRIIELQQENGKLWIDNISLRPKADIQEQPEFRVRVGGGYGD